MNLNIAASLILFLFTVSCSADKTASEYLKSAISKHETGELSAALIEVRNAVLKDPENSQARALLGKLELLSSNPAAAETQLLKALELGDANTSIKPDLAYAYLLQGKTKEILLIDESDTIGVSKSDILGFKVEAAILENRLSDASNFGTLALQEKHGSAITWTALARLLLAQQDTDEALANLDKAIKNSKQYSPAWELLGDIELQRNFPLKAAFAYEKAIGASQNSLSARIKKARLHLTENELDEARIEIEKVEALGVRNAAVLLIKSEIQLQQGKLVEAKNSLENLLRDYPTYLPAVRLIAVVHMIQNSTGQAEQYGLQLLSTEKSDSARELLATIRLQGNRYSQVKDTLLPLAEAERLQHLGARVLVTALIKLGELDSAINTMLSLHRALNKPNSVDISELALLAQPSSLISKQLLGEDYEITATSSVDSASYLSKLDTQLLHAVNLYANEKFALALDLVNKLIEKKPRNAALYTLKARSLVKLKQTEKAMQTLQLAMDLAATPGTEVLLASALQLNAGNSDKSLALLMSALNKSNGAARTKLLLGLANIYEAIGDSETALTILLETHEEFPSSYRTSLTLASFYSSQNSPQSVLDSLSQLSEISLQNSVVAKLKAQAHLQLNQFVEAKNVISPMILTERNAAEWRYLRAKAYAGLKEHSAAKNDLEAAIRIEPNNELINLAILDLDLLQQSHGGTTNKQGNLNNHRIIESQESKNQTNLVSKNSVEFGTVDKNNSSQPTSSEVIQIATSEWNTGRTDSAISTLDSWLSNNPSDTKIGLLLANAHESLNQIERAIDTYERVLTWDSENFTALNNLAWHTMNLQSERALEHAKKAVDLAPTEADKGNALHTLGMIHFSRREDNIVAELKAAEQTFRRISQASLSNPTISFHKALVQSALSVEIDDEQMRQAAISTLTDLIDNKSIFPELEEARALLEKLIAKSEK